MPPVQEAMRDTGSLFATTEATPTTLAIRPTTELGATGDTGGFLSTKGFEVYTEVHVAALPPEGRDYYTTAIPFEREIPSSDWDAVKVSDISLPTMGSGS